MSWEAAPHEIQGSGALRLQVGQVVRNARIAAGISQMTLSSRTGITQPSIARLEVGADPRVSTLIRLARVLGPMLVTGDGVCSVPQEEAGPAGPEPPPVRTQR